MLQTHTIHNYYTKRGVHYPKVDISFQEFGLSKEEGPTIIILHALTGNSNAADPKIGWWKDLFHKYQLFDLNKLHVLSLNIPGNGYGGFYIDHYQDWIAQDIAILLNQLLEDLQLNNILALIGGSLGGGIAWEMALLQPERFKYLIPIASDWKATDWIIGHTYIQHAVLQQEQYPLRHAREIAMMFYRSPHSLTVKFNRKKKDQRYDVVSWLNHHGVKLDNRFAKSSYVLMNHLMATVGIEIEDTKVFKNLKPSGLQIIQIGIDSDILYTAQEMKTTKAELNKYGVKNHYYEIKSIHGHDAFLIEQDQIASFLKEYIN